MFFIDKWDFKDITKYTQSSNIELMLSKDKKKTDIRSHININTHQTFKTNYIYEKRVWEPKKCDMTYFAVIIEEQLFKRFEKVH